MAAHSQYATLRAKDAARRAGDRSLDSIGSAAPAQVIGRYAIFSAIASGGMATVHIARLLGPVGFSRTVAIKKLHAQYARDPEFVSMALDEARLAARIQHPNVVSILDIAALDGELFLVMDYIHGESLSVLLRTVNAGAQIKVGIPPCHAVAVVAGALHGLHAAHEARSERGEPLNIVHRDVSPQNILVGVDGVPRVVDFGIAKATNRVHSTRDGQLKGKVSYMAPEQLMCEEVDRRTDVYAASAVLWEALVGRRLFPGEDVAGLLLAILHNPIQPPSRSGARIPRELDEIVLRGLARDPDDRFATAREMALALEEVLPPSRPTQLGLWVESVVPTSLRQRAERVAEVENSSPSPLQPADTAIRTKRFGSPARVDTQAPTIEPSSARRRSRRYWAGWVAALAILVAVTALAEAKRRAIGAAHGEPRAGGWPSAVNPGARPSASDSLTNALRPSPGARAGADTPVPDGSGVSPSTQASANGSRPKWQPRSVRSPPLEPKQGQRRGVRSGTPLQQKQIDDFGF